MNYNSKTVDGHDYSVLLRDMLPAIIGKRSKNVVEIAAKAGRRPQSVRHVIERLHDKGQVHIKRWKRGNAGPYVAYYFWGPGVDAPRPEAQPRSVVHKRYRETENGKKVCRACRKRWRKSAEGGLSIKSYNRGRWAREKFSKGGVAAIDPLLAAIMF